MSRDGPHPPPPLPALFTLHPQPLSGHRGGCPHSQPTQVSHPPCRHDLNIQPEEEGEVYWSPSGVPPTPDPHQIPTFFSTGSVTDVATCIHPLIPIHSFCPCHCSQGYQGRGGAPGCGLSHCRHHHITTMMPFLFIYFCSGEICTGASLQAPLTPLAPNTSVPSTLPPPSPFPPFQLISSCAEAASSICSVLPPQPHFPAISAPISLPSATSTTGPTHSSSPTTNCRH